MSERSPMPEKTDEPVATETEGIFRLGGNVRRINELEVAFDSPDRYGRGLDWTGYTVHDAANILRRYFNRLPQPIVPLEFYERFRAPLKGHQDEAVRGAPASNPEEAFDVDLAISTYQQIITQLPPLNRQLLLYILDLLAVFASKAEKNRMDASNLASIFQPGMLNHPDHVMKPSEYSLNQDIVIFLIQQQDNFLVGMPGTAADEQTVQDIQNAPKTRAQGSPRSPQTGLGRSASNASAGADSARRLGALRRHVSVSSKHSRNSSTIPSPGTPGTPHGDTTTGVHRSNTVPSKKSPNMPSGRFSRPFDRSSPGSQPTSAGFLAPDSFLPSPSPQQAPSAQDLPPVTPSVPEKIEEVQHANGETVVEPPVSSDQPPQSENHVRYPASPGLAPTSSATPAKERRVSNLFSKSPASDSERKDVRHPNKLKKKRIPESSNPSARSSTHSLMAAQDSPASKQEFFSALPTPRPTEELTENPLEAHGSQLSNTEATPQSDTPTPVAEQPHRTGTSTSAEPQQPANESALKPLKSPPLSVHSRSSVTDLSEGDALDLDKPKKRHRWRSSFAGSKPTEKSQIKTSTSQLGTSSIQEQSSTSVVSGSNATKSTPNTSQQMLTEVVTPSATTTAPAASSSEATPAKDVDDNAAKTTAEHGSPERKGPIKWLKAKVAQAKEERKEREAEKERAKSPSPPGGTAREGSKLSLNAIANESVLPIRGRSEVGVERSAESAVAPAKEVSTAGTGEAQV